MSKPFSEQETFKIEYLRPSNSNNLLELQRISQAAYSKAFFGLLNKDDVDDYIISKYSLSNLKNELEDTLSHFLLFCVDDRAVGYTKCILKPHSLAIIYSRESVSIGKNEYPLLLMKKEFVKKTVLPGGKLKRTKKVRQLDAASLQWL